VCAHIDVRSFSKRDYEWTGYNRFYTHTHTHIRLSGTTEPGAHKLAQRKEMLLQSVPDTSQCGWLIAVLTRIRAFCFAVFHFGPLGVGERDVPRPRAFSSTLGTHLPAECRSDPVSLALWVPLTSSGVQNECSPKLVHSVRIERKPG